MHRLACLDVPALPLQLLLQRHPDWRTCPVAVVDKDSPQGVIQWVNEPAFRKRVRSGLRYAAGLSLTSDLRADVIEPDEIQRGIERITDTLTGFTPEVEPSTDYPGVFWLNAAGLDRLYPSLRKWAGCVAEAVTGAGFRFGLALGVTRFGTYAAARSAPEVVLFRDLDEERDFALQVSLDRLDLEPSVRDGLGTLGVRTVGDLVRLPASGLKTRFGEATFQFRQWATDQLWNPLQPEPLQEQVEDCVRFDFALRSRTRLARVVRDRLPALLLQLSERGEALERLELLFCCEPHWRRRRSMEETRLHTDILQPAAPTLDRAVLNNLVNLRFESLRLPGAVLDLTLTAHGVAATREQLRLFRENPRRSLQAAQRALARVRAELGDDSVLCARLRAGHLPEAKFLWESLEELVHSSPTRTDLMPLVRRVYDTPLPLSPIPRHPDDGWMPHDLECGPVQKRVGPFVISGGWWGGEVCRDYHYVQMTRGDLLWAYYNRQQRRWVLQGNVE